MPVTRDGWIKYYMKCYQKTKSPQALHLALWLSFLNQRDKDHENHLGV